MVMNIPPQILNTGLWLAIAAATLIAGSVAEDRVADPGEAALFVNDGGNIVLHSDGGDVILQNASVVDMLARLARVEEALAKVQDEMPPTFDSCLTQLRLSLGAAHGRQLVLRRGSAGGHMLCEHDLDGGGWTLVAVSSDDAQDTWTWARRALWSNDTSVFGSLASINKDYKSDLLHRLNFTDLLFVHNPSQVWASYHGVGSGRQSLGEFIGSVPMTCYGDTSGFPMSAGNLGAVGHLCSTDLYFNAMDNDGLETCKGTQHSFGPVWSTNATEPGWAQGCPFDDPGQFSSLGPCQADVDREYCGGGHLGVGFGTAIGRNVEAAPPGSGINSMMVFVR